MFDQVIKHRLNQRFEKGSEPVRMEGEGAIRKQRGKPVCQECIQFAISTLEYLYIKAKLIAKVLTDQAFVVVCDLRNGIDSRSPEAVLSKDGFGCIENHLACFLCITCSSSVAFKFRHAFLISFSDLTSD